MPDADFLAPIAQDIWEQKYRLRREGKAVDQSLDDTFRRVANAAAVAEPGGSAAQQRWAATFHDCMSGLAFLPAGRILAGAGAGRNVTLFNCFVMGKIDDNLGAIFENAKQAALTMQAGGGIGHDFSTLRPRGAPVRGVEATASGPVSFMDVWDAMCRTLMSAGQRRGAMMATLRCDHPDIEEFIAAKSDPVRLRNFNLSILVTDAFIGAVKANAPWNLVFDGHNYKTVSARDLWHKIARANYDYAEPGVVFIDRINAANNLSGCETIHATNPCGEQPLPPYGACLLGSINLAQLIDQPFTTYARLDTSRLIQAVAVAVRLLDNVIDISRYPLPEQQHEAQTKRRIGLGVTGLASALIFTGTAYNSAAGRTMAQGWMHAIQNAAYRTSANLAAEKGAFPLYDAANFLDRPNVRALDSETRALIAKHGIRNGCLTSIAPTGTISLLAGNVSSGIEPVFDFRYLRRIRTQSGGINEEAVEEFAHARYRQLNGGLEPSGPAWVTVAGLVPHDHLAMQAVIQPYVDSAISKTINCPAGIDPASFENLYMDAYDLGLKGCTLFRPNEVTGSVLSQLPAAPTHPAAEVTLPVAKAASNTSGVVYMTEPLARDHALPGKTYKLKWPSSDHAYYITINDLIRDGRRRPFEIFINTKDLNHYAWTVALTRMISAVFRRGGDVSFVAEELKAIFDPQGGQWISGQYVPSLLAAIGGVIEAHLTASETVGGIRQPIAINETQPASSHEGQPQAPQALPKLCPRCSQPGYRMEGSCRVCINCWHSSCS
ncbi:MAG: adenosylcobalamin-dependent ribonucleoside-diphosphate reductase [Hyphomicrobiaceae bacterium]